MHSHAYVGVSTMESGRRFDGASSLSGVREMIAEIFESWPAPGKMKTYLDMGARLGPQLEKMDGVISIERFQSFSDPGKLLALPIWRVAVRRIDGQVIFNSRSGRFFADDGIVFRYRWRVDSG
jgi:hypothetical protein